MKDMLLDLIVLRPDEKTFEKLAERLADQATVNAEMVLSASVIVLAHSTADDVFTSACRIAMGLDPESWIGEVNQDRSISLGDLRKKSLPEIFTTELERFSARVSAKSIVSRSDLLFKHVPIRKHREIFPSDSDYYKRDKLKEADDLRQKILHGNGLPQIPIGKAAEMATFLNEAALTAGRSIVFQFNLPIDMTYLSELFSEKT